MACQLPVLAKITNIKILSYSLKGRMEYVDSQTRSRSMLPNFGCTLIRREAVVIFLFYDQKSSQPGSESTCHPEDEWVPEMGPSLFSPINKYKSQRNRLNFPNNEFSKVQAVENSTE